MDVVRALQRAGFTAYFAGGGVRDRLLGRSPKDFDVATSATPDQVQTLFPGATGIVGKSFGVVKISKGQHQFDVATFRSEASYSDGRRPDLAGLRYPTTPEEDAQRRDFTINGLFFDPLSERLIDFVSGKADLEAHVIRAIGDPEERFREDKLRLLRAIRFATTLQTAAGEWFEIEEKTWNAICRLSPNLKIGDEVPGESEPEWRLAPQRVREELDRIWSGPRPQAGLDLLDASGLLRVILPEIAELHGVEQPPEYHPEGDVYQHVRLMLSHLHHPPLVLALGVLFHDVAKKHTYSVENGRIRFHGHEAVGAEVAAEIMRRLRYSNDTMSAACELVGNHMQFKDVQRMKVSKLKQMLAREHFSLELELHRIDCLSSHSDLSNYDFLVNKREELSREDIKPPPLLNGRDVLGMGVPPGRKVGEMLEKVYEAQLEGTVQTHEEAVRLARRLASE